MPFVSGFLRLRRRGRPDQGLPPGEGPVDPDYGLEEGGGGVWPELPDIGLPPPPPGVWPPLTPDHPWEGGPAHPIELPPGTVWPPLPPGVKGKYLALVLIGGGGHGAHYRYVVIDADQRPEHPIEGPPTAQPKRA